MSTMRSTVRAPPGHSLMIHPHLRPPAHKDLRPITQYLAAFSCHLRGARHSCPCWLVPALIFSF
eukprot:4483464-Prorocentrum_lima.AAC.1